MNITCTWSRHNRGWRKNLGFILIAYKAIGVFIVPQMLWHGASVSAASPEGPPCSVTLYDKGYWGPIDMYFNPAPFGSLISMVLTERCFSLSTICKWAMRANWILFETPSSEICRILTMGSCNKWHASVGPFRDNVQISQGFKFLRWDICQVRIYIAILALVWRKHLYMRLSFGCYRRNKGLVTEGVDRYM